jgi:hypothetical protein
MQWPATNQQQPSIPAATGSPIPVARELRAAHAATGSHPARGGPPDRDFPAASSGKLLAAGAAPSTRTAERMIAAYDLPGPLADAGPSQWRQHLKSNVTPRGTGSRSGWPPMLRAARERSGLTFREAARARGHESRFPV